MVKTDVKSYDVGDVIMVSDRPRRCPRGAVIDVVVSAAADFGANSTNVRAILHEASVPADH
jgi:hypothetical protein